MEFESLVGSVCSKQYLKCPSKLTEELGLDVNIQDVRGNRPSRANSKNDGGKLPTVFAFIGLPTHKIYLYCLCSFIRLTGREGSIARTSHFKQ